MSLLDQFSNVLKQYTSGSTQNAANGTEHFDQVAQAAPQSVIAEGLSAVFRSDQTPAFDFLVSRAGFPQTHARLDWVSVSH